ncbi:MAG: hypothetical protein QGH40_04140 [bacterium]|jgi:hypothetical protein|nr:hypothetical protein [bacterium]|tara:strand:- start:65 stop:337 length:273 start_codon:yes stop_codon:yes gene_type:complete
MTKNVSLRSVVYVILLMVVLQVVMTWSSMQVAEAKTDAAAIGRYQVSAYGGITQVEVGGGKGVPRAINGYVIIDTATGKVEKKYSKMQVD